MKRAIVGFAGLTALLISGATGIGQTAGKGQDAEFGSWSTPINLGDVVNSTGREAGVSISRDGLSLYFSSARPGAGGSDLYVSRRLGVAHPWEAPEPLAMLNTAGAEGSLTLSRDDRFLFLSSIRPGGFGSFDLFVSERRHTQDDFGWGTPVRLQAPPNGAGQEATASYFENPGGNPQLYFASGPNAAGLDHYVTELLEDGTWSAPENLAALNSPVEDSGATIRFDGLEMIFASRRGGPDLDLYVTRRAHRWDVWSAPEHLGSTLNSTATDFSPALSPNGRALYFASARPDTHGNFDLYVSTRSRIR
jgi:hypothetical protein